MGEQKKSMHAPAADTVAGTDACARAAPLASLLFFCSSTLPFLLPFLLAACANPMPPTGGPRDQTPPRIESSTPAADETEVEGRTVEINFSEYVDRESLPEALSVTPVPEGRLDYDWGGRSVQITFPAPLREDRTYLLTFDTALSDVHGVALEEPLTLAFSTGAQIDRGRLSGRVISGRRGTGRGGFDLYAYPDSVRSGEGLPERPAYRTQSAEDGTFQFEYLREGTPFYIIALRDQDRNRRPNPLEAFAVPPRPALEADSTGTAVEAPWVAAARDPLAPKLTRAAPHSDRRLALRFNEPVRLGSRTPARFSVRDTTAAASGRGVAVRGVYQRADQRQQIVLRTAPMPPTPHRARLLPNAALPDSLSKEASPVLTDTSGNAPTFPAEAVFTPLERADTLGLRFLGFDKSGPSFPVSENKKEALVLLDENAPVVRFNQPLTDSTRRAALVTARDTGAAGTPRSVRFATGDGTSYRLRFDPPLRPGEVLRLQVDGTQLRPPRDTTLTRRVRRLPKRALGALSGPVRVMVPAAPPPDTTASDTTASDTTASDTTASDTTASDTARANIAAAHTSSAPVIVELYAAGNGPGATGSTPLRTTRADSGRFVFTGLPEGSYRFRAFLDRNRNGRWDRGRLTPYRPAEPVTWSARPLDARPRWETASDDTLRIDEFRSSIVN